MVSEYGIIYAIPLSFSLGICCCFSPGPSLTVTKHKHPHAFLAPSLIFLPSLQLLSQQPDFYHTSLLSCTSSMVGVFGSNFLIRFRSALVTSDGVMGIQGVNG